MVGYIGREHEVEMGDYYYRARWYDPGTGRFLSEDPIGFKAKDTNLYRYVFNNPMVNIDPSGQVVVCTRLTFAEGSEYFECSSTRWPSLSGIYKLPNRSCILFCTYDEREFAALTNQPVPGTGDGSCGDKI